MSDDEEEIGIAFAEYSGALGRVVHSWNRLHERLAEIFIAVVGGEEDVPRAVWHSSLNDRAQRTMLRAAVEARRWDRRRPQAKADLLWLIQEVNSLANHRDDAVHAPVYLIVVDDELAMAATRYSEHQRAKNLVGKELIVEFDYYERRADAYYQFAGGLISALRFRRFPWPERPALPNRRPKTALLALRRQAPAK